MSRMYHIFNDEEYNQRDEDKLFEKAFKEGCEHGYKKAMREAHYDERRSYNEGFEEKIEKLKRKYE